MNELASTFRTAVLVRREVLAYNGEPNRTWRALYRRYVVARNAYANTAGISFHRAHQEIDRAV